MVSSFFLNQADIICFISELKKTSPTQLHRITQYITDAFFIRLRIITSINLVLAVFGFCYFDLVRVKNFLLDLKASCTQFFKKIPITIYAVVIGLALVKIVLSVLMPLTTDELFNFNNYVVHGPLVSLSFGIGPNNHVMHTFLTSLVYGLTDAPKFSVRAVELFTLVFFFLFFLKKYSPQLGWAKALLVLLILNLSVDFFWQSIISRGYILLFVFSFAYLHYSLCYFQQLKKYSLAKANVFGVLATCVLPTFLVLPLAVFLLVLLRKKKLFFKFLKSTVIIACISFLFYEPIIIFSGKNFMLGNNWIQSSTNFKDQILYFLKELLSLSGFGSWALGIFIVTLQLIKAKKEPLALLGLLLWLVIVGVCVIFQYTPPVRVFILILAVSFLFISEVIKTITIKQLLFVIVLVLVIFVHNLREQLLPVYRRYNAMEHLFKRNIEGKIFTNNDLYFNKAKYLHLTENYPDAIYATGRISKLKYLILRTETKLSETTLEEYQLVDSNQEVNLYKRKK